MSQSRTRWKWWDVTKLSTTGTNLAAIATAVVTLLTLFQIKKQTEYSYRPDVMLNPAFHGFNVYYENSGKDIAFSATINDRLPQNANLGQTDNLIPLSIYNVGLGSAKYVECHWDFNAGDLDGTISFNGYDIDTRSEYMANINTLLWNNTMTSWANSEQFEFVLPVSETESNLMIGFDRLYLTLWTNLMLHIVEMDLGHEQICQTIANAVEEVPPLHLNLEYFDIGKKGYKKSYVYRLIPTLVSKDNRKLSVQFVHKEVGTPARNINKNMTFVDKDRSHVFNFDLAL